MKPNGFDTCELYLFFLIIVVKIYSVVAKNDNFLKTKSQKYKKKK